MGRCSVLLVLTVWAAGPPRTTSPSPHGMTCRSTGGGDENRKVCFPEDLARR